MEKLKELREQYKNFIKYGYNNREAAERAVNNTFINKTIKPYIYKDEYQDPSHLFFNNQVFFFDGDIYKKWNKA